MSDASRIAHVDDDVDIDRHSHHHTLGLSPTQAAAGNAGFQPGDLKMSAAVKGTDGWLKCDGTVYERIRYPALFAAISTEFNTGGETGTQFRVPDLRDRVPVGTSGTKALGDLNGADTINLQHSHPLSDAGQAAVAITAAAPTLVRIRTVTSPTWNETQRSQNLTDGTEASASVGAALMGNTDNAGSTTQNIMPKSQAVNFWIKT